MKTENEKCKTGQKDRFSDCSQMVFRSSSEKGFTLIELVITVVVLSVLALGTVPLVQNAVRRQKEQRLRETLREIRLAIDEFRHEAIDNPRCAGNAGAAAPPPNPRRRVMIADCKIFEASKENPDRYPPKLEILVEGVEVMPLNAGLGRQTTGGGAFGEDNGATGSRTDSATGGNATEPKKKFYLREMPIDPITGESDWQFRSSSQEKDATSWDENNVFDVRSNAKGETLDGVKYRDL